MKSKKTILFLISATLLIFGSINNVAAQDAQNTGKKKSKFGNLVRKVGEATTGINMSDETFTVIPMVVKKNLQIEIIGCYGDKASETVTLIFTAKAKSVKADFRVGSSSSDKAYDSKGNSFDRYNSATKAMQVSQDCPVGVPIKYELTFEGIPTSLESLELISLAWWMSAGSDKGASNSNTPNLEFRNLPILWDIVPE